MDVRKAFVVDIIAGAIAPQQQKVGCLNVSSTYGMIQSQPVTVAVAWQAAYADHFAKDESGAIAAFLDHPGISLLQVSLAKSASGQLQIRMTTSADFPKGCLYQVG